ncbi:MAG: cardiolipin synthase B [Gammaproteobacteria bacterium CG_4_10_14_0_8_um_filter_38_16]|nr:MAG: cardiolipin synthase B [Gammaproteobacteria bacterium CG_4_10_14_0_8_um_filter_38_16]PJA04389.1 MAG: cardiolipin synthase B [Gammaproteobacteria bacterium CG_4_10_14_0_2_um_filter_38_22]PJB10190.1 MAG: cardiolipin synthase B [Gammaproteobacteria bacterium CG_4_9_14_3_um_filter_38_9]
MSAATFVNALPQTHASQSEEQVLGTGSSYFNALLHDIQQAKNTIDLETFIFSRDVIGKRVANALCDAAQRGIAVRVLVDAWGSPFWSATFARRLEKSGVKTKIFHPFPWQLWNWSRSVGKTHILFKGIHLFFTANSRNHRKICLIDNKIAYVGSVNITECHLSTEEGGKNWRDTVVRLFNVNLTELYKAFEIAWTHRTIKERLRDTFKHIRKEPRMRLNYTRHRRRILHKNLLRRIRLCQRRIWITNAYFVPDNFLLRRLKEAAENGVDVRILLPRKSNVTIVQWASSTFYHHLLKAGIKIYEYLPGMLHAKSLILDDWMLIGSSNLNHRSLLHDLEADITLFTEHAKKTLEQLFLKDLTQSQQLELNHWQSVRRRYQRILGRFSLYLKYWI